MCSPVGEGIVCVCSPVGEGIVCVCSPVGEGIVCVCVHLLARGALKRSTEEVAAGGRGVRCKGG